MLVKLANCLKPGEEGSLSVGVMFLASGSFGFRAAVEEIEGVQEGGGKVRFSQELRVDVVWEKRQENIT
jgi:hypothetical protein